MLETTFILKNPQLEDSQNYVLLRETGIKHIEQLARQIWTDYNIHDPGITLLENLCYAITDLGYRTGFDIKDILTEQKKDKLEIDSSVFHTANKIFPCKPVTFNDLRKILIDITGVKQAWISKNEKVCYYLDTSEKRLTYARQHPDDPKCDPLNGLYNVLIQKEDFVEDDDRVFGLSKNVDAAFNLDYIASAGQGIALRVRYPVTLKKVDVYLQVTDNTQAATYDLKFYKKDDAGVFNLQFDKKITVVDFPVDFKYKLEIEESLSKGEWQLAVVETSANNITFGRDASPLFPHSQLGVVDVYAGHDGGGVLIPAEQFFVFNPEFSYTVSPVERESADLLKKLPNTVGPENISLIPGGGYRRAFKQGILFNVFCPLTLNSVDVNMDAEEDIKISLLDKNDEELKTITTTITKTGEMVKIDLGWSLDPALSYRLVAYTKSGVKVFKNDNNIPYPFELDNVIELASGISNTSIVTSRYYYFYNWNITYTPCLPPASEITLADINAAVKEKLYIHRNLCEDFMNIEVLKTEEISVCMDIEVRPEVDIDETLAEIYYQLELHVSPPVNFYTIQELLDKGKTPDEIFEGPLLDHGFIDHDEFVAIDRRTCLRTSDIIQIIMDVEGVTAVKTIKLLSFVIADNPLEADYQETIDDEIVYYKVKEEDWVLELQDGNFYAPDFSPERSKTFFYKNGLPYMANRANVAELLSEKRAQQIKSKLRKHQTNLSIPVGNYRNLEDYFPVQNDLPETYYTGQNEVPNSRSNLRKAQSKQLKGYLLFFEQILANYLSQLGNIKSLFSWKKTDFHQSYFTQKLKEISNIEQLYIHDYENELGKKLGICNELEEENPEECERGIIESDEVAEERKNRFLDHLIARFSESLVEYGLMMESLLKKEAAARLITDKQAFLGDYPRLSSERARGFDYRYPHLYDNLTGFQRRAYRLLGIYDEDCTVGRKNFASPRIKIIEKIDGTEVLYAFRILRTADSPDDDFVFESNCCESYEQICTMIDTLIPFGANPDNWCELDDNPFNSGHTWVLKRNCVKCDDLRQCKCDDLRQWISDGVPERAKEEILGYTAPASLTAEEFETLVLDHFKQYAYCEGFHVVENILLRKRSIETAADFLPVEIHTPGEECECLEVKDPYSFRASVILPSWPKRFRSTRFRQLIEKTLRFEAPAHVYLRICWISHCEMQEFEKCHDDWLDAHAVLDCKFRGERPLPPLAIPADPLDAVINEGERVQLTAFRETLNKLIEKLYNLNNIFTVARIHGCEDVDSEEPQVSLNNTSLGSL